MLIQLLYSSKATTALSPADLTAILDKSVANNRASQITGLLTFPFQRISGTSSQNGCGAAFSVARFAETFMFLSRDTLGTATIGIMQGYEYKRLSTHAVENSLVTEREPVAGFARFLDR